MSIKSGESMNQRASTNFHKALLSFFLGASCLCFFSTIQKLFIGAPLTIEGYLVPFLFGGFSGAVLGRQLSKVAFLNNKLSSRVDQLESVLPICSSCKKIMKNGTDPDQMTSWVQIESYIASKTSSQFTHGICPQCENDLYGDFIKDEK